VRVEPVALIPNASSARPAGYRPTAKHWSAYLTDDEPPELAFYCPDCRDREFGDE
jgi:hypothetical protein